MIQFLSLLSLAIALVQGIALPELAARDGPAPVKLDFTVSKNVGNSTAKEFWSRFGNTKLKRDGYPETITDYKDLSYQIDVYLGSNNQKNTVVIDTGSSDLWVSANGYNPNNSQTASDTGNAFSIGYLDGSGFEGEFFTDTLQFASGNPVINNFQFAQAETNSPGILGIADKNQESSQISYDNLPYALKFAGITSKASYSLYLGPDLGQGSLIFGGIDTEKYTGNLEKYSIDLRTNGLAVDVKSATFNGKEIAINGPILLDSGTSLGLLNQELILELDKIFDTTVINSGGIEYRKTSCSQPSDKSLDFNFGANTISIPYSDAIVKQDDGTCLLGFGYYQNNQIFGDVFLRKAYVYYDLSDQTISLAQASCSTSSNIISA